MEKKLIYKQRELKDCGACCLASIIAYYNGSVPLNILKEETFTSLNGTTAYHLITAAKNYGFECLGLKIDNIHDARILLPAIAHLHLPNGLDHFVVIYEIKKDKLILMDPSVGKKTISVHEFNQQWTNVIINFKPVTAILKMPKKQPLSDLIKYLLQDNQKIFFHLIIGSIILTISSVVSNYFYEIGLNTISTRSMKSLYQVIFVFTIITFLKVLSISLKEYYQIYLDKNIDFKLIEEYIDHTLNLPLNIVKSRTSGEILSRLSDLKEIKYLISEIVISLFIDTTLAITSAFLLYRNNHRLFYILCIILIIYFTISLIFNKITFKKALKNIEEETKFHADVLESIENIESIKNTHSITTYQTRLKNSMGNYLKDCFYFSKTYLHQNIVKELISEVGLFAVTSYAFILIFQQDLELSSFMTFNAFIIYLLQPLKNTADLLPKYNYIKALLIKINEYLSLNEEHHSDNILNLYNGNISFQKVSYSFDNYNYILDNLNFTINQGEKVFLKGPSGSGKSTICKLLYRHLTLNKGKILIGGVNINDYPLSTIRANITYVSQREQLFNDTLLNNLTIYSNYSIADINRVLDICELSSVVDRLPYRLDSIILKDAANLSGGEKQRVILARALLQNKPILILDEALSEVSTSQEKSIVQNIINAYPEKTIIYVSHKFINHLFTKTIRIGGNNGY